MVGACERAWRPTCLRWSGDVSPLIGFQDFRRHVGTGAGLDPGNAFATSSRTARKSAVVAGSNMGTPQ